MELRSSFIGRFESRAESLLRLAIAWSCKHTRPDEVCVWSEGLTSDGVSEY